MILLLQDVASISGVANALPQMGYVTAGGNVPLPNQYGQMPQQGQMMPPTMNQPQGPMGPPQQQQLGPNQAALAELINFD
jgi:hypothetical protein